MDWISVKDKLPKKETAVLVWRGMVDICGYMGNKIWLTDDENMYPVTAEERGITHWMPLPEPPKEVTK